MPSPNPPPTGEGSQAGGPLPPGEGRERAFKSWTPFHSNPFGGSNYEGELSDMAGSFGAGPLMATFG
jgi:hypothetical protein